MGLIDKFNELIVEHGSAVVMAQHRDLFRDQLVAADKEIAALKEENRLLKDENKRLKADNENLTEDIHRLQEIVNPPEENQSIKQCDEVQEQILRLLYDADNGMYDDAIRGKLALSSWDLRFHLDALFDLMFIQQNVSFGGKSPVEISKEGRAYLKSTT